MNSLQEQTAPPDERQFGLLLTATACLSLLLLYWPALYAGPLVLDEHGSYWMLESEEPSTVWERCLSYGAVPPLYSWLQQGSLACLGKTELALRLPGLVGALLAVGLISQLGTRLHSPVCGGLAACLLVWHPDALDEIRIARCYGVLLGWSSALLWATQFWREGITDWRRGLLWGLAAAAMLWTHYTVVPYLGLCLVVIILCSLRDVPWREWLPPVLLAGGVIAGLCWPLLPAIQRLSDWSHYLNLMAPEQPWWNIVTAYWWLGLPAGLVVGMIVSRGSNWAISELPQKLLEVWWQTWPWLLCSLLPIALLALVAVGDLSSLANPRYRVVYAPASALAIALLLSRLFPLRGRLAALLVVLGLSWSLAPLRPWELGRLGSPADQNWHTLSLHLQSQATPHTPLFVQSGLVESSLVPAFVHDRLFLEYVACRVSRFYVSQPHPRIGLPFVWDQQVEVDFGELLQQLGAEELWIAAATDTDLNLSSVAGFERVLDRQGYRLAENTSWEHATLKKFVRSAEHARR